MSAVTVRLIEIRARISAGGIAPGHEARRVAQRATEFVRDDARAEELAVRLERTLGYFALLSDMNGGKPGCCGLALKIVDEIESASR
jgi:hypothetical protein